MFRNHLKTALRSLFSNKIYSAINIVGLAVGLTAVILILLYLRHELTYENFHENADHVYRISVLTQRGEIEEEDSHVFTPPIGPAMKQAFPEVDNYTRLSTAREVYGFYEREAHKIENLQYADSTLFDLFSFDLLAGHPSTILSAPYTIVLSQALATRVFGEKNPLGEIIALDDGQGYEVTGIVADNPVNSHLQFDALVSFNSLYEDPSMFLGWDGGNQYITYIKLKENTRPEAVEAKFPAFMWGHINETYADYGLELKPYLQPLKDLHLFHNPYSKNLRTNLGVFGLVGLLILFIACVNFMNLTTAQASRRAKEIGVRKVLGAKRKNLVQQFLGETYLITTLAFLLALFLAVQLYPLYGTLLGKELIIFSLFDWPTTGMLLLLLLLVGLAAGSYPALYLSSQEILKVIQGVLFKGRRSKNYFRNGLIIFQFTISAAMIVSTIFISRQIHFMQNKELGFDQEQILILPLVGEVTQRNVVELKQELLQLAQVKQVSASSEVPGRGLTANGYTPEGEEQPLTINVIDVDERFMDIYGLKLSEGRFFSADHSTDDKAYVVNEAFLKMMNWQDPIGKVISRNGDHRVIGVVEDFHFDPLYREIKPLILTNKPWQDRFDFLAVKLNPGPPDVGIAAIQDAWSSVSPNAPLDLWFLDESLDQTYRAEMSFRKLFLYFSTLSILIALLGIWGLAALSLRQRTKEVGIRKILGASITQLITLLSREFLLLVTLALAFAFPISWLAMNYWLDNFAYTAGLSWWVYLVGGMTVLLVAFLTVAIKALYAARANPVEALRYE